MLDEDETDYSIAKETNNKLQEVDKRKWRAQF
jgi:hypothetical protein